MDLKHLRGFLVLSEELHFGHAAARLGIPQPVLSQQIRRLESDLARVLFDRSTRSVTLTEAGRALVVPVRRALDEIEVVKRTAALGELGLTGRVVVGFAGLTSNFALPLLARTIRTEQPGIELVLKGHMFTRSAGVGVASGALDLAFTRLPVTDAVLAASVIGYESLVMAMPSDHAMAQQKAVRLSDFSEDPFVTYPAAEGSRIRDALLRSSSAVGFQPRIVQEAPDTYTLLSLVAAGAGVTLTVSGVRHIVIPELVYRDVLDDLAPLTTAMIWRRDNSSSALRTVLRIAREVFGHGKTVDAESVPGATDHLARARTTSPIAAA